MKYLVPLALLATGCSALGIGSNLDKQSTSQNLANVRAIAADSERFAPAAELPSVKVRNARAIELADKMDSVAK